MPEQRKLGGRVCASAAERMEQGRRARHASGGFTLIELMVVVAIIGTLLAVALPSYKNYVIRGQLANASTGLTSMKADMERYYQDYRTYASGSSVDSPCVSAATIGNFVISCNADQSGVTGTTTAYTLGAKGKTGTNVAGFTFTVDQTDLRKTTAAPTGWNTCATRWIMKKEESC